MAFSSLPKLVLCFSLIFFTCNAVVRAAQLDESSLGLITDALEWSSSSTSMSDLYENGFSTDEVEEEISGGVDHRRSLFWRTMHYYISYGALSANRVPCPPRSGRSYYTHNCFKTRSPVRPYNRGCSRITRCRR